MKVAFVKFGLLLRLLAFFLFDLLGSVRREFSLPFFQKKRVGRFPTGMNFDASLSRTST